MWIGFLGRLCGVVGIGIIHVERHDTAVRSRTVDDDDEILREELPQLRHVLPVFESSMFESHM